MLYLEVPCEDCGEARYLNCDHITLLEDHELGTIITMLSGEQIGLTMSPVDFLATMQEAREKGLTAIRPETIEMVLDAELEKESSAVN